MFESFRRAYSEDPVASKLEALARKAAARTVDNLWFAGTECFSAFTPSECANYFTAAGYDAEQVESALGACGDDRTSAVNPPSGAQATARRRAPRFRNGCPAAGRPNLRHCDGENGLSLWVNNSIARLQEHAEAHRRMV